MARSLLSSTEQTIGRVDPDTAFTRRRPLLPGIDDRCRTRRVWRGAGRDEDADD
jgi:hypothetical protein